STPASSTSIPRFVIASASRIVAANREHEITHTFFKGYRLYILVGSAFYALAILAVLAKGSLNFVVSDGRGYYVYLPSLILDGDLDFSNQIKDHWDVDFSEGLLVPNTATGKIGNKYPIGTALTLAPAFLTCHVIAEI